MPNLSPHLLQRISCPLILISLSSSRTAATQGTQDQPVLHLLREGEEDGGGGELPGLSWSRIYRYVFGLKHKTMHYIINNP